MEDLKYQVSIVIPMYNSQDTISKTIDGLINQTYYDYVKEIIVVDDGSNDNSSNIVKMYQKMEKKIILINKDNGGVSSARNIGMNMATGNWIAFCDSDDIWLDNKLEEQIQILKKNPEIDFLGTNWSDRKLKILFKEVHSLYKANIYDLCLTFFPQPSTVIMKKSIFDKIGGFDDRQRYAEEGSYFYKICLNYNYYIYPKKLINFGNGKSGFGESGLSANLKEMYKGNIKNLNELKEGKFISNIFYYFLRFYFFFKYIRRIVLSNIVK